MKNLFHIILFSLSASIVAQPNTKAAHMLPIMAKGYYLTIKGDTVKGEIQTNPENPTDIYNGFNFRVNDKAKLAAISSKKAKGYGFEGRHFIMVPFDQTKDVYIETLVHGRINFYEYRFNDTKDGEPTITSNYYVQDTGAEEKDAELKELKPINTKFYKKELKPYMKAQPSTWTDFDKFVFSKPVVVKAMQDFNKYYEPQQ